MITWFFSSCVHTRLHLVQNLPFLCHDRSSWFSVWCCRAKIVCFVCFYLCCFCCSFTTKLWLPCYDFPWTKKSRVQTRGNSRSVWIIKEARQVKGKWMLLKWFRIMWPQHLGRGRKDLFMKKFSAVSSYQKSRRFKVQEKRNNIFSCPPLFAIINQISPLAWMTCAAQWNLSKT